MLATYRVAAKGLVAQLLRHEVLANNLANARTSGFQPDQVVVAAAPSHDIAALPEPVIAGSYVRPELGGVRRTDNPFDFAVRGDGYFVVSTPEGTRLTRGGALAIRADGALVNAAGHEIQGSGGVISTTAQRLEVTPAGEVLGDGSPVGAFAIRALRPGALVVKTHDGYLETPGGEADLVAATHYEVLQGYVEDSAVEPVREMVDMIGAFRAYEAGIRSVQAADETLGIAVGRLGRLV